MMSRRQENSGELSKALKEHREAGGAPGAPAGTRPWFGLDSSCLLVDVSDSPPATPVKCGWKFS